MGLSIKLLDQSLSTGMYIVQLRETMFTTNKQRKVHAAKYFTLYTAGQQSSRHHY